MIELAAVALVISGLAGVWDLKTTEVPDELAVALAVFGLAFWYFSALTTGAFTELAVSAVSGTVLLGAGLALFHRGSWGEADAWILAGMAYTIPILNGRLFLMDYIINLAVVGGAYSAIFIALFRRRFRRRIRTSELRVGDVPAGAKWSGLSESDITALQRERKTVVIKEGVRFVPAFPLALVVTMAWGNVLFLVPAL